MKKVLVLGAGMVGRAIAIDLSKNYSVVAADINEETLEFLNQTPNIKTIKTDLTDSSFFINNLNEFDLVVSAVPGFLGFQTLKNVIKHKKNIVDISFMPEDMLQLSDAAVKNNVTAVVDCGVAPGMPNLILGYLNEKMKVTEFEYMVGGLPKERTLPYQYKAPFSPVDVIEEYTRPARMMINGNIISKPAMSEPELVHFKDIGHLEAFNTDGLRSLLYTMKHIPNMKEKTLRYPGHINIIKNLLETGLFDKNPINIKGQNVIPMELTCHLLFNLWKLKPSEEEFTVMKIKITGEEKNKQKNVFYELIDFSDKKTHTSSMARTTGYTATAIADYILKGKFDKKGVFPPELIGKYPDFFEHIINYLNDRGVKYVWFEN